MSSLREQFLKDIDEARKNPVIEGGEKPSDASIARAFWDVYAKEQAIDAAHPDWPEHFKKCRMRVDGKLLIQFAREYDRISADER